MTEPRKTDGFKSRKFLLTCITMATGVVMLVAGYIDGQEFVALMATAGGSYMACNAFGKTS